MIVATSVNIPHTSFTNEFDLTLIEMMLECQSSVSALHELQCQMLRNWQRRSSSGIHDSGGDICDPLPIVWAYYQTYGIV